MNRRSFISAGAAFAATTPFVVVAAASSKARTPNNPLPEVENGQILTAEYINSIIKRINEIDSRE